MIRMWLPCVAAWIISLKRNNGFQNSKQNKRAAVSSCAVSFQKSLLNNRTKMPAEDRNVCITFQKNTLHLENANKTQNCRKKLQDTFEQSENSNSGSSRSDRSVLSAINLDDTRKAIRNSTERITKTLSNLRTSLGSFSQVILTYWCRLT